MALTPACDLFIIVGEASGDAYGAAILQTLRERHPELVCAAMGGERLAAAGADGKAAGRGAGLWAGRTICFREHVETNRLLNRA